MKKKKKLIIIMDEQDHNAFKSKVCSQGKSMTDVVYDFIKKYLKENK